MNYFGYDHTKVSPLPSLTSLISCVPDLEEVKSGNELYEVLPEKIKNPDDDDEELDINQMPLERTHNNTNEFSIIDLGSTDSGLEETVHSTKKDQRVAQKDRKTCCSLCSRTCLAVIAMILGSLLLLLLAAAVFREQRDEPSATVTIVENSTQKLYEQPAGGVLITESEDKDVHHVEFLSMEGEVCSGNNDCTSGLCRGTAPPYVCKPKQESCHLCSNDRNCLSGRCVRRSGKSICASSEDGIMDVGCFCDADDDCASKRCEGEPLMYTCRQRTTDCTSDLECSGVCNSGQCSDGEIGGIGKRQPTGDKCSGHADCSSRICVRFAPERDGICSEGQIGSICGTNSDCETERCIHGLCDPKAGVGGECKGNIECDSGLCIGYSDYNSGLCMDTSEGNSCQGMGEACSGLGTCVGGFCKNFHLAVASVCLEDADCLSRDCSWSPAYGDRRCR